MRVLHVTHQYHPAIGGAERYITDVSEALARRGHVVDVYTSQSRDYHTWRNELPYFERLNGVNVHRFRSLPRGPLAWRLLEIGLRNHTEYRLPLFAPHIFVGNGPVCPQLFLAMLRHAPGYDLIHINQLHYAHAWTAYVAAKARGRPIVLTPHIHVEQPQTYDIGYLWRILHGSDAVLADTAGERGFLAQKLPGQLVVQCGKGLTMADFPPRNVPASRRHFGLPDDGFVLLFLGRKTEYKGLAQVLRAFTQLRQQRDKLYLLAVGPETEHSEQLWRTYGGAEGLVVRGAVTEEERLDALAACDLLALPSVGEAFGIVYLEAWAYGKPVIGANIQSVASLIDDGVDGLLVDPQRPGQLLDAMQRLVDDGALARQMGAQGNRKLKQRFTTDHFTDVTEGVYRQVIRRANHGAQRPQRAAT